MIPTIKRSSSAKISGFKYKIIDRANMSKNGRVNGDLNFESGFARHELWSGKYPSKFVK